MKRFLILVAIFFTFHGFSFPAEDTAEKAVTQYYKSALVIGNSKYTKISPLLYAREDAKLISQALESLGFHVTFLENVDRKKFKNGIREWAKNLKKGGVALFHYCGHGMQSEGSNYLVPVDANIPMEDEIEFESINAGYVLKKMRKAGCHTNIIILDACREDPFSFKDYNKGFAEMQTWYGSIIIYPTRIGETASDKESYSKFLYSQLMNNPELELKDMLNAVRNKIIVHTLGKQIPLEIDLLKHDFYFISSSNGGDIPGKGKGPKIPGSFIRKVYLSHQCRKNLYPETVRYIIEGTGFFDFCLNPVKTFINQFKKRNVGQSFVIIDNTTDLMWHDSGSEPMPRKYVETWLHQLNDKKYAGYEDWRLPTLEEAASLLSGIKNAKNKLYTDSEFSKHQKIIWTCDNSPKETYNDESLDLYWAIDFENGIVARFDANSEVSVRPVRRHY